MSAILYYASLFGLDIKIQLAHEHHRKSDKAGEAGNEDEIASSARGSRGGAGARGRGRRCRGRGNAGRGVRSLLGVLVLGRVVATADIRTVVVENADLRRAVPVRVSNACLLLTVARHLLVQADLDVAGKVIVVTVAGRVVAVSVSFFLSSLLFSFSFSFFPFFLFSSLLFSLNLLVRCCAASSDGNAFLQPRIQVPR